MPYIADKRTKCVYLKKEDGSRGKKVGCTKGSLKKYLAALHIHAMKNEDIEKFATDEEKEFLKEQVEVIDNLYMLIEDILQLNTYLIFHSDPFANRPEWKTIITQIKELQKMLGK